MAAECAGEQGKYWDMHDLLFNRQDQWSGQATAGDTFKAFAGELGLDQAQFDGCLDGNQYAAKISADQQQGIADGVSGTPAFRINGAQLSGAQPFSAFQQQIEYYLAGGTPPEFEVPADSYRSQGAADAPVVVTEFSDYQCPACGQVELQVIPELISRYVDTGKVRFVYREFPIESLHPNAVQAAEAAVCAGELGNYWDMHQKLFETAADWGAEGVDPALFFKGYAEEIGLDANAFAMCLEAGTAANTVQGEIMAGQEAGVNATPYFFVNELPIRGGLPIEALGRVIDYVADGGPAPEIVPADPADYHVVGDEQTAQAITVAFLDFANAESAQHMTEVFPQLQTEYIDKGQLVYILHPWVDDVTSPSGQAAVAAECAGKQGKFWEMAKELFAEQAAWSAASDPQASFGGYAEGLGLDSAQFEACLSSPSATLQARAGAVVGALYGVPGAPVFLFNNGQGQQGSPTFDEFKTIIDSMGG